MKLIAYTLLILSIASPAFAAPEVKGDAEIKAETEAQDAAKTAQQPDQAQAAAQAEQAKIEADFKVRIEAATAYEKENPIKNAIDAGVEAMEQGGGAPYNMTKEEFAKAKKNLNYDRARDELIQRTAEIFTADEIKILEKLSADPATQAMLSKIGDYQMIYKQVGMRAISEAAAPIMNEKMKAQQEKMEKEMEARRKEEAKQKKTEPKKDEPKKAE
jgi:hypothetical protein